MKTTTWLAMSTSQFETGIISSRDAQKEPTAGLLSLSSFIKLSPLTSKPPIEE
jgi:hypothetical protein